MPETNHGMVRGSAEGDEAASNAMAEMYRKPLEFWLRRNGCDHHLAEEVVQDYLANLLDKKKGTIRHYDPKIGSLRAFLKTCARNFLSAQRRRARCQKRGGGAVHLPLEMVEQLQQMLKENAPEASGMDAACACGLFEQILAELRKQWSETPQQEQLYRHFEPLLLEEKPNYAKIEEATGTNYPTLRAKFSRVRRSVREQRHSGVRQMVKDPAEVEAEKRALMRLLAVHWKWD